MSGHLAPGDAGDKVWGLHHRALIHRAEHNAPGVTRRGDVILTLLSEPETYVLPDAEPWWEPPDRVPLEAGGYVTWVGKSNGPSERYADPALARSRFDRVVEQAAR